jgi:hypothetical protein
VCVCDRGGDHGRGHIGCRTRGVLQPHGACTLLVACSLSCRCSCCSCIARRKGPTGTYCIGGAVLRDADLLRWLDVCLSVTGDACAAAVSDIDLYTATVVYLNCRVSRCSDWHSSEAAVTGTAVTPLAVAGSSLGQQLLQ